MSLYKYALACMAVAIVAAAFAPIQQLGPWAPVIKAAATAATGLAALFLHPPAGTSAPPPAEPAPPAAK